MGRKMSRKVTLTQAALYRKRRVDEFRAGFHDYMVMKRLLLDSATYGSLESYCYNKWVAEYTDREIHPEVYSFLERSVPQFFKQYGEVSSV